MKPTLRLALTLAALAPGTGFAGELLISRQGSLLLAEDFDTAPTLPEKFTSGVGAWTVMDGALRGQQQPKDKHTAFRKIFLDHQDVIYQFDLKIEGGEIGVQLGRGEDAALVWAIEGLAVGRRGAARLGGDGQGCGGGAGEGRANEAAARGAEGVHLRDAFTSVFMSSST